MELFFAVDFFKKNPFISTCFQDFDGNELYKCIEDYVKLESKWIPPQRGFSLYIRPTMIAWEVSLLKTKKQPVSLLLIISIKKRINLVSDQQRNQSCSQSSHLLDLTTPLVLNQSGYILKPKESELHLVVLVISKLVETMHQQSL